MTDYEAVKAGAKEAVTEWLDTTSGREAIAAGARSAVLDWIELTAQGSRAVDSGAERAVTAWLEGNKSAIVRAVTEGVARRHS